MKAKMESNQASLAVIGVRSSCPEAAICAGASGRCNRHRRWHRRRWRATVRTISQPQQRDRYDLCGLPCARHPSQLNALQAVRWRCIYWWPFAQQNVPSCVTPAPMRAP